MHHLPYVLGNRLLGTAFYQGHWLRLLEQLTPVYPADTAFDLGARSRQRMMIIAMWHKMLAVTFVVVEGLATMTVLMATRVIDRCLDALVHLARPDHSDAVNDGG